MKPGIRWALIIGIALVTHMIFIAIKFDINTMEDVDRALLFFFWVLIVERVLTPKEII